MWQTLKAGFRGLETVHLTANAMTITAQRAVNKLEAQKNLIGKDGSGTTIAGFRAGLYLRHTQLLLEKIEETMQMLVREEPKLLRAICVEKRKATIVPRGQSVQARSQQVQEANRCKKPTGARSQQVSDVRI